MIEVKRIEPGSTELLTPELGVLFDSFSIDHLKELVGDNRTYLFIAWSDNDPVGYALAYKFPALDPGVVLSYLYDIDVLPSHQRKGIGRMLIEAVVATVKKDGVTEMWLGTATDNYAAQALFKTTGAEKTGETFYDYTYYL
jgi:ribosomal protein S18 acetylase RimI-like enzyme